MYYTRHRPATHTTYATEHQAVSRLLLHPYVGYTYRPGRSASEGIEDALRDVKIDQPWRAVPANNQGFFSAFDYPYTPRYTNEFIVGIFGGSVAKRLALQAEAELRSELSGIPALQGREITILNFAQGGYKQPQQLLLLSLMLAQRQHFDAIVNIDGFNEVVLSARNEENDVNMMMPNHEVLFPLVDATSMHELSVEQIEAMLHVRKWAARMRSLEQRMLKNKSAAVMLIMHMEHRIAEARYTKLLQGILSDRTRRSGAGMFFVQPASDENREELLVAAWAESSRLMHRLVASSSCFYIHILQPNQYHSEHVFDAEERAVALREETFYPAYVQSYYPRLINAGKTLVEQGVSFVDGTRMFDLVEGAVFEDECCHLTLRGNEILAAFVAQQVAQAIRGDALAPSQSEELLNSW